MKWRKGISTATVLKALSESRTINGDGSTSFRMFDGDDCWLEVLQTALADDSVSSSIHAAAIKAASRRAQAPTAEQFMQLYEEERARIKKTTSPYLVAFPMWGKTVFLDDGLPSLTGSVSFWADLGADISEKIELERSRLREEHPEKFGTIYSDHGNYKTYVAEVYAHTPVDAFERAYRELSAVVGCVTFVDGTESISLFGDVIYRPAIDLLISPQSTVHHPSGDLAYDGYWFSEWVPKSAPARQANEDRVAKVRAEVVKIVDAVKGSPWRQKSEGVLSLYYSAFSEHQASNSLLAGWRLLEVIAGGQDVRSEILTRRMASFYEDSEVAAAIGFHLRERRNASAHGETLSTQVASTNIRQLRGIIRVILAHFLMNPSAFSSLQEFWTYCDTPRNDEGLASMERVLKAAKRRHLRKAPGEET